MKTYLLVIGDGSGAFLPPLLGAVAAGFGGKISGLDLFHLRRTEESLPVRRLVDDLNRCRELFAGDSSETAEVFSASYAFSSAVLEMPSLKEYSGFESDSLLLSALRGKGIPLSFQTDRDAVSWAVSARLNAEGGPSTAAFREWLEGIRADASASAPARVVLLFDPSDAFEAGAALSCVRFLRGFFDEGTVFLSLLGVMRPAAGRFENARQELRGFLEALDSRNLLRRLDGEATKGADALWVLSLPASASEGADTWQVLALPLVRVLKKIAREDKLPSCGLHVRFLTQPVSWKALEEDAAPVAAFLRAAFWFESEMAPVLRALAAGRSGNSGAFPRNVLTRRLQKIVGRSAAGGSPREESSESSSPSFDPLDRALRFVLSETVSLLRAVPPQLLPSSEMNARWAAAISACGRAVTTASELDVSRQEAEESGLDQVMPVHRVSMADTEEEKMLRRLDEMEDQLASEKEARQATLRKLGGAGGMLAILDCRTKCESAREANRAQLARLTEAPNVENLTLMAARRRSRLLDAAILRCRRDQEDLFREGAWQNPPTEASLLSDSAAGPLSPEVLTNLEQLLRDEPAAGKALRARLGQLFPAVVLPDEKATLKSLSKQHVLEGASSVPDLFRLLYAAFLEDLGPVRWPGGWELPPLPLLPDIYPEKPVVTLRDLLSLLPSSPSAEDEAHLRGLLAFLWTREYWRPAAGEGTPVFEAVTADASPLAAAFLNDAGGEKVWIVSLKREEVSLPFALILPGLSFRSARFTASHADFVPAEIAWFDRENGRFRDPVPFLSETDRSLLLDQLEQIDLPGLFAPFAEDLRAARDAETTSSPDLEILLKAVCGLADLPAYRSSLRRTDRMAEHALDEDRLSSCLAGRPMSAATLSPGAVDVLYLWRDVPFARKDPRRILIPLDLSEKAWVLKTLSGECETLSDISDDYQDALVRNLLLLRERMPDASEDSLAVLNRVLKSAGRPIGGKMTKLTWPWDPLSPSVQTVMRECLGNRLSDAAMGAFSDLLIRFPARGGDVIGDTLLCAQCTVMPREGESAADKTADVPEKDASADSDAPAAPDASDVSDAPARPGFSSDALLPPLSPSFAAGLCHTPEGRTLINNHLLSFRAMENGSIRVTLTLEGAFSMQLIRIYSPEEIVSLYAHDMPTVAVWPNLPFSPEHWHAYFVYAHVPAPLSVSMLTEDEEEVAPEAGVAFRSVSQLSSCPVCLIFRREDKTAGALPNLLPRPNLPEGGNLTVCLDLGSAAASVVLSGGGGAGPLQGSSAVRVLLNNPAATQDLLRNEFLPSVSVSALIPAAVRLFHNAVGEEPVPLRDGILLLSSGLRDVLSLPAESLYAAMKWDDLKGRSLRLCAHQIMLLAALQARSSGASSLSWRFAVPDGMAAEGREYWVAMLQNLAQAVSRESGFPPPPGKPMALFAPESQALAAYFRSCAPEDTRGGFMTLDLGASAASVSLNLRGREETDYSVQLPLGIHMLAFPSLMAEPQLLSQAFGFVQDPAFLADLNAMQRLLVSARTDPAAFRQARLALDAFLADWFPLLSSVAGQSLMAGAPARLTSLILLDFSFLMMLAGLLLLRVSADPMQNDFLPDQITLCIAGRGSQLMHVLPDPVRQGLWRMLTMFRNERVSSLTFLFSSEKKLEIPVGLSCLSRLTEGLPRTPSVPSSLPVRPEALLPEFILRFRAVFPVCAEQVFPGFFAPDPYHPFSAFGESLVSASIQHAFSAGPNLRPFDALSAWLADLKELIREHVSFGP